MAFPLGPSIRVTCGIDAAVSCTSLTRAGRSRIARPYSPCGSYLAGNRHALRQRRVSIPTTDNHWDETLLEEHLPTLATSDQTGLFFTDQGTGSPVVFTHSWALNSDQ